MSGDSNDKSLENFFNNDVSDQDGTKRNLRFNNASNPIDGYAISEEENNTTSYYGYLNQDGKWYIQRSVRTSTIVVHRYKRGDSGYNWANRADPTYASFDATF